MVRLSLIVLGLLAAAWCFTGAAEGLRVKKEGQNALLSCGRRSVIRVVRCYRIRSSCSGPAYTRSSVKHISGCSIRNLKRICNGKRGCSISRMAKGPYACKYRCVRNTQQRSKKMCHTSRGKRHCHRLRRMCGRTRRGKRECAWVTKMCRTRRGKRECAWVTKMCRTRWRKRRCAWVMRKCHRRRCGWVKFLNA